MERRQFEESNRVEVQVVVSVMQAFSLPLDILIYFIYSSKSIWAQTAFEDKVKNITEWQALQPIVSNKSVLPLFLSSNSVYSWLICTHRFSTWAVTKHSSHHVLLLPCSVALWDELPLTHHCLSSLCSYINLSLDCYWGKAIVQKWKLHVALNGAASQCSL